MGSTLDSDRQSSHSAWRGEWSAGGALLAASIICATASVIPLALVGVLLKPLEELFGWSRASVSSAVLLISFGTLGMAPIVGPLIDRIGPRKVALRGLVAVAGGTACIGLAGPSVISWYVAWMIFAVTQSFANAVVWSNAIVSRFDKARGLALAVLLSGQALCFGAAPLAALWIMERFGWRWIFFAAAALTLLVAWPLAWRFFFAARDLAARDEPTVKGAAVQPVSQAARSFRSPIFWRIAVSFAIAASTVSALVVHLQPILIDSGVSSIRAASAMLILAPASALGRLGSGILVDRFPAHWIASLSLILPATSYGILLALPASPEAAYACAFMIGMAAGAEADLLAYIVSRYFPREDYARVYSVLLGMYAVGYGASPVLAGAIFDAAATYAPVFLLLLTAAIFGAVIILSLGRPPARVP